MILSLGIWLLASATLSAAALNVGDIVFVQQSGGRVSYVPGTGSPTLTNLSGPLMLEPLDFANSSLGPVLPSPQLISQGGFLFDPNHVLIDPLGRILTAERSTATPAIVRIDPTTGIQTRIASGSLLTRPVALAFDLNQNLVVANANGNGSNNRLVHVNMTTGAQSLIAHLTFTPQDVDVDSNGQIVITGFGSKIARFDPLTGNATIVSADGLLTTLTDLVIQPNGNYLVSNRLNTTSQILEIDAGTGAQRLIATVPREGWIALENANSLIYADFHKTIPITRIDLATGATTPLSDLNFGTGNITGVAVVTAIPEPSSIAGCVMLGLAVAGWVRRKTKK